jgi:hypothetical protein
MFNNNSKGYDRLLPYSRLNVPKNLPDSMKGEVKTNRRVHTDLREFKEDQVVSTGKAKTRAFTRTPEYHVNDLLSHEELLEKNKKSGFNTGKDKITWRLRLEGLPKTHPFMNGIFHSTTTKKKHMPKMQYFPVLTFMMESDITNPDEWIEKLALEKKLELKIKDQMLIGSLGAMFPNMQAVVLSVHLVEEWNALKIPFNVTLSTNAYSGKGKQQQWISVTGPNPEGAVNQTTLSYTSWPTGVHHKYLDKMPILWSNDPDTVNGLEFSRWINENREELDSMLMNADLMDPDGLVYYVRCPDKEATIFPNMLQFLIVDEWNRIGSLSLEWKLPKPDFKTHNDVAYFAVSKKALDFLINEKFEIIAKKDDHIMKFENIKLTLTPVRLQDNKWLAELRTKIKLQHAAGNPGLIPNYHPNCLFKIQLCCEPYEGSVMLNNNNNSTSSNLYSGQSLSMQAPNMYNYNNNNSTSYAPDLP